MRIPGWTKRWGPTVYLAIAMAGPLLYVFGWLLPRLMFMVDGERRVGLVETQIASVVRVQRNACQVNQWLLWWVSVNSRKQGWIEIPPHVLAMLQGESCGGPAAMGSENRAPSLTPPAGAGAIAGELPAPKESP